MRVVGLAIGLFTALMPACGGGNGETPGACEGLSLADCRVTAGCVADQCDGCGCQVIYRGCLAADQTPEMCPGLGCPSGICCSSEVACDPGAGTCTPPGVQLGCGACDSTPGDCAVDADCTAQGASMICDPLPCGCSGQLACTAGCTDDTTCGEGTTCDLASARCQPIACDGSGCPTNFECVDHGCARVTCTDDLACDGFCVDGACYAERGECLSPPP